MTQIRAGSVPRADERPAGTRPIAVARGEMATFFAWEKLRLLYNAILTVLVFDFEVNHGWPRDIWFWLQVAVGALLANVCFCVGPVVENYLRLLGRTGSLARLILFCLGTLLAVFLADSCLHSLHSPPMWDWH